MGLNSVRGNAVTIFRIPTRRTHQVEGRLRYRVLFQVKKTQVRRPKIPCVLKAAQLRGNATFDN